MDIEESKILLKDFQKGKIEKDKLETYKGGYKLGYFYTVGIQEAIETVLSELENKQDDINILQAQRDSMEYQFKQAKAELEKKDTEIIEAKEANRQLSLELEKKEAIINEMAKHIHLSGDYECLNKECEDDENIDCEECIKEYFTKKAEKEGK